MTSLRAKTIAIIGAGPSGLVAAKYLRAEKAFDNIVLFEQRARSGGIWNYTPEDRDEDLFTIPQTNPRGRNQDPVWRERVGTYVKSATNGTHGTNGVSKAASFLSPVYEKLETNIPRGLMGFQDLDWPQDSQLFPKHQTVLEYIETYGKEVEDLVQYETQVIDVQAVDEEHNGKWTVKTRNLRSNSERTDTFDAVIVANGHFIVPYIPDIEAIREWNAKYPGLISHSKYYRRPEEFEGKKVVVVGNSASGVDISTQIAAFSQHPILWSSQSSSMFKPGSDTRKRELPPIAKFLPEKRGVVFEDGTTEHEIDAIVFATGYFYSLPFLENVKPELIGDGSHVQHTYKHLFYAPRPTLSFLVLNQRVIPFPVAEAQSAVLARVYSGRLSLPNLSEMVKWEEETIVENGNGRSFHVLPFPKDGNYINELASWSSTASPQDGLENDGHGKRPPVWGEWEFWCRENFPAIRGAFGKRGDERFGITKLEELGFNFEEHLKEKAKSEGKLI
ncbi:flavin-containing monooxygenase [Corynespora cassiicola Philippines]|uniref:Flavin-containing monooxygenase n=1 Tax=Corynespora cassiicola Philippines TaxID=1448308 RepID=A0A2T2PAV5_CORCC|nr:flavin-containing monooxygenase [Corynespora cassiicola Philippines]